MLNLTDGELRLVALAGEQLKWIQRLFWLTLIVWVGIPALGAVVLIFGPQALLTGPVIIGAFVVLLGLAMLAYFLRD